LRTIMERVFESCAQLTSFFVPASRAERHSMAFHRVCPLVSDRRSEP
jgi:hypothetical protein